MKIRARWKWLGGLVVTVIGTVIAEQFKNVAIFGPLWRAVLAAWDWLRDPVGVAHGLLLLLGLAALAGLIIAVRALLPEPTDPMLAYTKDRFYGIDWLWWYDGRTVRAHGIVPICPECGLQMTMALSSSYYGPSRTLVACEECGFKKELPGDELDVRDRVLKQIQRNLRDGVYPRPSPGLSPGSQ